MTDSEFPSSLREFGYGFNDAGQMRQIDKEGRLTDKPFQFEVKKGDRSYNQRHYEALGEVVTEEVYDLLEKRGGLKKVDVDGKGDVKSFVFLSDGFSDKEKVVVLIHGSGVVRAGQWTRKLIINEDLDKGTMLPFIKHALDKDWGVLVLNTNHNIDPPSGEDISGSSTPEEHARTVWRQMVQRCNVDSKILVIAHSYGGVVTVDLARKFKSDFLTRVVSVLMTDSVHGRLTGDEEVDKKLRKVGINFVASDLEVGAKVDNRYGIVGNMKTLSAGDTRHEWTSWAAKDEIFRRMDQLAENQERKRDSEGELKNVETKEKNVLPLAEDVQVGETYNFM